jgi:hypothetical protein
LRKYYPKNAGLNKNNKAIYIVLLLDLRVKRDGLESTGINHRQAMDIYNKFYIEYQMSVDLLIIVFIYFFRFFLDRYPFYKEPEHQIFKTMILMTLEYI